METNDQIVKLEQQIENLQSFSPANGQKNSISLYSGVLTPKTEARCVLMLKQAFPQLPVGFYNILHDMIRDEGFSDSRLVDAVKHVIKTCVYPTPTIAQIVNFDRRIKLHTYGEVCAMISKGYRMVDFEKRKYRGGMFWVLKSEVNS